MLKSLLIKDYALIENIEVKFSNGLNIITGETGAGKSILIDAMGLLLGERASNEIVRKGADKSIVEGIFDISSNKKVKSLLINNDIDSYDELIIRREVSLKGTNRCFLNDTPVTLNVIKEVGDLLVDLHGQHEHQSLLKTETHIDFLDEFAQLENELVDYKSNYSGLNNLQKELKELQEKENILKEKKDLYSFQIKEIDSLSPMPNEDDILENELRILENAEKILNLTNQIYETVYDGEDSILERITSVKNSLSELEKIDQTLAEKVNEAESVIAILNDIASHIRSYKNNIDIEPEKVEEIRQRLGAIHLLKKKYGGNIASILEYREKISKELELAENFTKKITKLQNEIENSRISAGNSAKKLSQLRKSAAKKVKKEVENALNTLGISDSVFDIQIVNEKVEAVNNNYIITDGNKYKFNEKGIDHVEFYISTNIGEDPKPLVKVASGGEVSRIMLALKSSLAKSDKLPILIFDEIDTGVSGRIAQKVGQILKSLAAFHQIIAITHLPQIAGLSDSHYTVEKKKQGDRMVSSIKLLSNEDRVREVAKLMSGEKITEAAIEGAKELMNSKK